MYEEGSTEIIKQNWYPLLYNGDQNCFPLLLPSETIGKVKKFTYNCVTRLSTNLGWLVWKEDVANRDVYGNTRNKKLYQISLTL